ncbi:hypothetical protein PV_010 (endogenous virus) [Gutovirus Vc1]|uniref:Uncharacterized protein n=1 Tax=Vibrio phage Vc1 TaxID=1480731 RepID=X2KU55_9CAUD|nr:internal virion protein [Vibrio phage Vc1]AHN84661.1 hypothetical protein PV_010 [Vibrio phage Vc1]
MAAVGAWYAAASAAQVATVVATAVSVAAAVQQTVQARANANAQEEAAERHNEQLVEQTVANYDELAAVEREAQQRALDDTVNVQKDYLQNKGRINVMAAAMGTGGQSVASQLGDLEREKYTNYNTILLSRQAEQDNIRSQAENMRYQAASGMQVSPVSRPSWASAALNVGATALSGYSQYQGGAKDAELLRKPAQQTPSLKSGG